ncbi:hypothetical protein ACFPOE_11330 [Caenimonas terrae]|uniref:Enoyl-CoA hydratase n=1 Tax=Caenimonas terrae TaxID=696074 RepID=A0ABW0NG84_9BURK
MVRLALYRGPAPTRLRQVAHRLICWRTRGPYSHVELIDADGWGWSSSWLDGGVRRKAIDFGNGHWDLRTIDRDLETAVKWFEDHKGEPYGVMGLLTWLLPFRVGDSRRPFCSEAVALAIGMPNAWQVSPNDLPTE